MVRFKQAIQWLVVIGLTVTLWLPVTSYAQAPSRVVINYPELIDLEDALQLGLYFTITDSAGRVVPDARVQSARILTDDGVTHDAEVEQPSTPFYITLVLDASGSMAGAAEAMRQAAIQAINDVPEQARFSVIRFNQDIDLLQDFTEDRNRAINAIGDVQPVNLSGTCLYDAAYEAIDRLSDAPQGRRAIILFTDGRDETAQGDPCSRHVYDDVVTFANTADSRVPIHTIGLSSSQQGINANELRNLASGTGGLAAIGDQEALPDLFQQIMDALKSQWLAKMVYYPLRGTHTATLTVTLEDGTVLQPASVTFEVVRDFQVPITPSPTPTPIIVDLEIESATVDLEQELVFLQVAVQGEQVISEYRFRFFDADTNLELANLIVPAPLPSPVVVPADELRGDIRVEMRAFDRNGNLISWPGERENVEDRVSYEFAYIRATPTPPPATQTAIPIGVELNSIAYDRPTDTITLDLSLTGQDQMGSLEINIFDADTNLRINVFNTDPAETVQIKADGLEPQQDYAITVIAQNASGQNLARSNQQKFTYTPLLTPTPTPEPTATSTATPKPIAVSIGSVGIDESTDEIVIGILTEDQDRIDSFELQLRDSETGLVVGEFIHTPPPYDTIRIPLRNITAGEYTAILRAFGLGGTLLIEASPLNFAYSPPPTPTPVPTATPSPTPTPTPAPGFVERVTDSVRDNPLVTLVVAVIGFALLAVLLLLIRPRKKPQTGTDFLSAQTGFYQMPSAEGAKPDAAASGKPQAPSGAGAEATMVQPAGTPDATDIFPGAFPPLATLIVHRSPAADRLGPSVPITSVPFHIGRGQEGNDLMLDEDTSVSRNHAVIQFEKGQFFIVDQGSSNGTAVDSTRLTPQTPFPLHDGARIIFGKNTEITFEITDSGPDSGPGRDPDDDPDKTDYVRIS